MKSANMPPRGRFARLSSYFLAGLCLLAMGSSALLNHRLIDLHKEGIATNQQWTRALGLLSDLNESAGFVNAPGNDVFDSKDVQGERSRMLLAKARFATKLLLARGQLRRLQGSLQAGDLQSEKAEFEDQLEILRTNLELMSQEAERIFRYLESDQPDLAGARMASMDRAFAELSRNGRKLEAHVRSLQGQMLKEAEIEARLLQRYEWLVVCLLLVGLGLIVSYGRSQERIRQKYEEEQEASYLALAKAEADTRAALGSVEEANRGLRLILDNVNQGLLTLRKDGVMGPQRSAVLDLWLGTYREETPFWEHLAKLDPAFALSFQLNFQMLIEDVLPLELCLSQMPGKLAVSHKHYLFQYHPLLASGHLVSLMVVITDVTTQVERDLAEEEQRAIGAVLEKALHNRTAFLEFYQEIDNLVQSVRECGQGPSRSLPELMRIIHTIKGNCGLFGIGHLVTLCHEIESRIKEEGDLLDSDREALSAKWATLTEKLGPLLRVSGTCRIEIDTDEYQRVVHGLLAGIPREELLGMLIDWEHHSVEQRFAHFADQVQNLARRLGKEPLRVSVETSRLRLPVEPWGAFFSTFGHLLRNAVDHGLETLEERTAAGKAACATIALRVYRSLEHLVFEVADDGRGIDWERVRQKAERQGLPSATKEDLVSALFADGFSTRDGDVTEYSGRGVGLSAVLQITHKLSGHLEVHSEKGKGTCFRFLFKRPPSGILGRAVVSSLAPRKEPPLRAEVVH